MRLESKGKKNPIIIKKRKIVKTGASFYVALPQEFIKKFRLHAGDELAVVMTREGSLKLVH
jgi:antitoxin component of MazEF toxin-antitoxin module